MLSLLKSVYQQFKKASTCILLMKQAAPHEKRGGNGTQAEARREEVLHFWRVCGIYAAAHVTGEYNKLEVADFIAPI